ncbi:hypothetical protein BP6252_10765 [Coleophoma cylindrospora]|uniref:NADP-dependent oxidoreductase domain-containing protein n=1 Tax=Coleophoma cylindrospora TaxID=1849047 RepID=A0A3D8QUC4_9HELO|nr:hypothetical protein BP6252_10765 [Coleophoma cylindrospora]
MSVFAPPPRPTSLLGYHRILSPNAAVKVAPIAFGGISIGSVWSSQFGVNEDPFSLLDAYFELGGNFIDTANSYQAETSEKSIGEWMVKRGNRDQIVLATKYSAGYRGSSREEDPIQSNFSGNSVKCMHVSVHASLKKLQTDYIDLLYVHWWDFATSVEEVMRGLHVLVMQGKILYLGVSNTPAWVVVKANEFAKAHGLTTFSVYQGKWNAAFRDMEAEIIPMCEDQGLAIIPWAALGGGRLKTVEQRKKDATSPSARSEVGLREKDIKVSELLERIAASKGSTLQAVAVAYLFQQSTYVFPIIGVQTVEHVKAMEDALKIVLTKEEVDSIHEVSDLEPLFPIPFLFNFRRDQKYDLTLTPGNQQQYQMGAWIDAPPKQSPYQPRINGL